MNSRYSTKVRIMMNQILVSANFCAFLTHYFLVIQSTNDLSVSLLALTNFEMINFVITSSGIMNFIAKNLVTRNFVTTNFVTTNFLFQTL